MNGKDRIMLDFQASPARPSHTNNIKIQVKMNALEW